MLSSLDILYFILAFCAIWLTTTMCWFIWQMIRIIRNISSMVEKISFVAEKIEQAIHGVKGKFGAGNVADHFKRAMGNMKDRE
jgi:hypothetical protein